MFESARIRLTLWYLLIVMIISFLFSVVIYASITSEYRRFEKMQVRIQDSIDEPFVPPFPPNRPMRVGRPDPEIINESKARILIILGIFNGAVLLLAGGAGYFLAGKTLRPIQKSMDEQKRFITDASHELRTPLTSLRTEIEVAMRKKSQSPDTKKLLQSNLEEVVRLQKLSDSLLDLAQHDSRIDSREFVDISVKQVTSDALKQVDAVALKKKIRIENKTRETKIYGMYDRVQEMLVILLDNAIKYSQANSSIEVASKRTKNSVLITVTDHGKGIAKEELPHVFDRFYRSDASRSERGYGLGLSIAQSLVQTHNGSLTVESVPHKKTTFTLTFPL